MACNQCYTNNIENTNKKRRLIGYFPIVLMGLFELYMFMLDINTRFQNFKFMKLPPFELNK